MDAGKEEEVKDMWQFEAYYKNSKGDTRIEDVYVKGTQCTGRHDLYTKAMGIAVALCEDGEDLISVILTKKGDEPWRE